MPQKPLYRKWHIPGLPDLYIAIAHQTCALLTTGGRAVGKNKTNTGVGTAQGLHQGLFIVISAYGKLFF